MYISNKCLVRRSQNNFLPSRTELIYNETEVDTSSTSLHSLGTLTSWVEAYKTIAAAQLAGLDAGMPDVQAVLLERLNAACVSLVNGKKGELREGDNYTFNKIGASLSGAIPIFGI